jgi:hypothetical protein
MVKLFNANGTEVSGSAVTVNTAGKPAGQFAYATAVEPDNPGSQHDLCRDELTRLLESIKTNGTDYWGTSITLSEVASATAAVWAYTPPPYNGATGGSGKSYGPVNLRYINNSTPDVTRTYKRSGQLNTVTDATGTRSFTYRTSVDYALDYETLNSGFYDTGHILKSKYNATDRRPEGYVYGASTTGGASYSTKHLDITTAFDPANGRLTTLTSLTRNDTRSHMFIHSYLGGSLSVLSVSGPQGTLQKRTFEPYRPYLKKYENKQSTSVDAAYEYTRDLLGQIDTEDQTGLIF